MPDLMRRAVNRVGVAALILAGLTLVVSSVSALVLAFGYRDQLANLKHVIYSRCTQRTAYDASNHASVGADVVLYRSLLAQAEKNAAAIPPRYRATERAQEAAIRQALATKEHAYGAGVIGSCRAYK